MIPDQNENEDILADAFKAKPLFIVGMNGSGTTMLLDNLGRHPELYAFPKETRLIPYLLARQARFGDLAQDNDYQRLWDLVRSLNVFTQANDSQPVPMPDKWRDYPRTVAGVLDGVFRQLASKQGKARWCEKTPQHAQHIVLLAQHFPAAQFIHMIRDGRDCAASFNRRWLRTPSLTMHRWKKVVTTGRLQGDKLGSNRYLEIRYEDLTSDPEAWLRKICEFLEIDFVPDILESGQPYLQTTHSSAGLRPNSGKWESYFTPRTKRQLEEIGGLTLASFGYQTDSPLSDRNIPAIQRRIIAARDALFQYAREIYLKLTGRIQRPWRIILGKPVIALRQRMNNRY